LRTVERILAGCEVHSVADHLAPDRQAPLALEPYAQLHIVDVGEGLPPVYTTRAEHDRVAERVEPKRAACHAFMAERLDDVADRRLDGPVLLPVESREGWLALRAVAGRVCDRRELLELRGHVLGVADGRQIVAAGSVLAVGVQAPEVAHLLAPRPGHEPHRRAVAIFAAGVVVGPWAGHHEAPALLREHKALGPEPVGHGVVDVEILAVTQDCQPPALRILDGEL
jgi:hypothetical protein